MGVLFAITKIAAGILLGISTLDRLDGERKVFQKIASTLLPFQVIIGGVLIGFAVLFFRANILVNSVSILGGLLLLTSMFSKIPALETTLRNITYKLMPFKASIGIALLVVGILSLF